MNKICTDIPQSRRLIVLGIDIKTADMDYVPFDNDPKEYDCVINRLNNDHYDYDWIPAWSLTALIDILPDTITDEDGTVFGLNINKDFIEYYNPSLGALAATYHIITAEDLVDAAFEMICWLKENGKI